MKKMYWVMAAALFLILTATTPLYATLDQALTTTGEGAVGLPVSLVKLVGGLVWTIGEVIALPFKMIF